MNTQLLMPRSTRCLKHRSAKAAYNTKEIIIKREMSGKDISEVVSDRIITMVKKQFQETKEKLDLSR